LALPARNEKIVGKVFFCCEKKATAAKCKKTGTEKLALLYRNGKIGDFHRVCGV
jgi:hypothetical protein